MLAPFPPQVLASLAMALLAAGAPSDGPWVSGSVLVPPGARAEVAVVELVPIVPNLELGRLQLQGQVRPEPVSAGRPGRDGRFLLQAPEKGLYRLVVRAPGGIAVQAGPLALVDDLEVAPVLPPPDAGVALEIVGADGRPVAGAWALVAGDEAAGNGWRLDFRLGKAGPDGRLTLPRRPGEALDLSVFAPAYGEVRMEELEGGRVRMPAAGAPRRLTVQAEDGTPRAGVLVRYGARSWPAGSSGADGTVEVPAATEQPRDLRLVTPEGIQQAVAGGAGKDGPFVARLSSAQQVIGRVVDARTGKPIAGALAWNDRDPGAYVSTDEYGRYRMTLAAAQDSVLEAVAAGYTSAKVELRPTQARLGRAPTVALARAATVAGSVMAGGRPVAGAVVEAVPRAARGERLLDAAAKVVDRAATDPQGRFRLRRLEPRQEYELRARSDGYFPASAEVAAFDPPAEARAVRLDLVAIRSLAGQVVDEAGRALAEVELEVRGAMRGGRTPPLFEAPRREVEASGAASRTDARGRFLVASPPAAAVDTLFRKPGFAPFSARGVRIPPGSGPFDFGKVVLRPGAGLRGRVVDGAGKPVRGAEVFLLEEEPRTPQTAALDGRPSVITSAGGEFALSDLPVAAPVHLLARAPGYAAALARGVRPPLDRPLVIPLEKGTSLRGRVVDEARAPIAGATVEAVWQPVLASDPERLPVGMPASFHATTGPAGRFEISGLPEGLVSLGAQARGYVAREGRKLELPRPDDAPELEIVLEIGATLAGRIATTRGEPVGEARVRVGDAGGLSDPEGQYLVEGAAPGRQRVWVFHRDYRRFETTHVLGPDDNLLDVELEAGVEVSGRVLDEQAQPVAGARVALRARDRREHSALSASDGAFHFATVPRARYRLAAEREGYASSAAPAEVLVETEPVRGLEVTLRKGATISGRILGLEPEDLSRVVVEASTAQSSARRAEIDAEGRYRLAGLNPGDWTLRGSVGSGERQVVVRQPVLADDRELECDLEFGGRLRLSGRVFVDGEPLADAFVSLRGQRFSTERGRRSAFDGSFVVDDLAPDTYVLGVSHAERLLTHNQTLDLAEDREIEVHLRPTAVRGQVRSAENGAPVGGARVSLRHLPTAETPEFLVTGFAGADGRFDYPRVLPGTYRVEVTADGFARQDQPLVVAAGDAPELDLLLDRSAGLELEVRLADGSPARSVHLLAQDAAGRLGAAVTLAADANGRAKLSTLAPGAWTLYVSSSAAALASVSVEVPGPPVALTLPPGGRLAVRVPALLLAGRSATLRLTSAAGAPLYVLEPGGALRGDWVLAAGQGTVAGLPEGPCVAHVESSDGRRWAAPCAVVGGQESAVVLE